MPDTMLKVPLVKPNLVLDLFVQHMEGLLMDLLVDEEQRNWRENFARCVGRWRSAYSKMHDKLLPSQSVCIHHIAELSRQSEEVEGN
jgi:hypothetical protein